MDKDIKFYIPFEGFYNSVYDSIIDDVINSDIEEGYLKNDDNINYKNIFKEMSHSIFDDIEELFNDEFDLFTANGWMNYEGLHSPKYYNYSTDKLIATINKSNYLTILNKFEDNEEFVHYVNESSKSRDSFTSFYNGIEEVKKESSIFLEYLFQRFVLNKYRDEVIDKTCDNIHEVIYNNL